MAFEIMMNLDTVFIDEKNGRFYYFDEVLDKARNVFQQQKDLFFTNDTMVSELDSLFKRHFNDNIDQPNFPLIVSNFSSELDIWLRKQVENYPRRALFLSFVMPVLGVFCLPLLLFIPRQTFVEYFFEDPKDVFEKHIEHFKKSMNNGYDFLKQLVNTELPEVISRDDFKWESETLREDEWAYAKASLMVNGKLATDGTKLRRHDHPGKLTHSYIVIGRRILAMAGQHERLYDNSPEATDKPASAKSVKLAEDEKRGSWAIKILAVSSMIPNAISSQSEVGIGVDLKMAFPPVWRNKQTFFKSYLAYSYANQTLKSYLISHPSLSTEERFDLAIRIAERLVQLQSGQLSQRKICYRHMDLHANNITVDKNGEIHFIDYGLTRVKKPSDLGTDDVLYITVIMNEMIFEQSPEGSNIKKYFKKFHRFETSLSALIDDLKRMKSEEKACHLNGVSSGH